MRNGVVHIFIHICGAFMHNLWTTSDQGKPAQSNAKIGMRKERSRGVLVTPARLLTTCLSLEGRPLVADATGRRADMSRRANKSVQRRDPSEYADLSRHTDRLIAIRAYRLGCRCDNCKRHAAAERVRYRTQGQRRARTQPKDVVQQRRDKLKFSYGITPEQYDEMAAQQGNVCAICRKPPGGGKRLCVDHDHYTGRVRGLLCNPCNSFLGRVDDDPQKIRNALAYLHEETATQLQLKCFDKLYKSGG